MIPFTCPCCEVDRPPHRDGCTLHSDCPSEAETFDEVSSMRAEITRLREEPRSWLTAAERDAVDHAADIIEDMEEDDGNPINSKADALRGLLARETPPMVRRPKLDIDGDGFASWRQIIESLTFEWERAIRKAGGEVEG